MLALPLTAAVLLHATPTQMGLLTAMEIAALRAVLAAVGRLARPRAQAAGLRRRRDRAGAASSPACRWPGGWAGCRCPGCTSSASSSARCTRSPARAAQIVLTQVVRARPAGRGAREERAGQLGRRGRRARARRRADQAGRRAAGAAGRCGCCCSCSALILRGIRVHERRGRAARRAFLARPEGRPALRRAATRLLVALARAGRRLADVPPRGAVGADPVRHAHARPVRAGDRAAATWAWASARCWPACFGNRISRRIGPGPCLVVGFAICGAGWLLLALAPANRLGVAGVRADADASSAPARC